MQKTILVFIVNLVEIKSNFHINYIYSLSLLPYLLALGIPVHNPTMYAPAQYIYAWPPNMPVCNICQLANSVQSFAPKIMFLGLLESSLIVVPCVNVRVYMPVLIYQCWPPVALVCLPHNACWCNICALIAPSAFLQKLCFSSCLKAS